MQVNKVQKLIRTLHSEYGDRVGAASALGQIGGPAAIQALVKELKLKNFYGHGDTDSHTAVCDALIKIGKPAGPALIRLLNNKTADGSDDAAEILAKIRYREAIPHLIKVLRNRDYDYLVRAATAWTLGKMRAKKAISDLITVVEDRNDDECVRYHATEALGKVADDRALTVLHKVLGDKEDRVRAAATEAICKAGGEISKHTAIQGLKDPDSRVRFAAISAIIKTACYADVRLLIDLLKNEPDASLRAKIVKALGMIGNLEAVDVLIETVKVDNNHVAEVAVKALQKLNIRYEIIADACRSRIL